MRVLVKVILTKIGKSGREIVTFTFLYWKIVGSSHKFSFIISVLDILTLR